MAQMKCIKCQQEYEEKDEEAYLCSPCLVLKQQMAAQIDAKFPHREENPYNKLSVDERFPPFRIPR